MVPALSARGGGHAVGGTHQKGIIKQIPQPPQAIAHGRLRQAELVGRLGDIALAQQHVQIHQQVEIDAVECFKVILPANDTIQLSWMVNLIASIDWENSARRPSTAVPNAMKGTRELGPKLGHSAGRRSPGSRVASAHKGRTDNPQQSKQGSLCIQPPWMTCTFLLMSARRRAALGRLDPGLPSMGVGADLTTALLDEAAKLGSDVGRPCVGSGTMHPGNLR